MTRDHYKHETIRELRESAGMTQEELAERLNVHKVTVSRVETGAVCSFDLLCKIAVLFGKPWQDILRIEDSAGENISIKENISCCV